MNIQVLFNLHIIILVAIAATSALNIRGKDTDSVPITAPTSKDNLPTTGIDLDDVKKENDTKELTLIDDEAIADVVVTVTGESIIQEFDGNVKSSGNNATDDEVTQKSESELCKEDGDEDEGNGAMITRSELELCSSASLHTVHEGLQKLIVDPEQSFTPKDFVCTLLNLLERSVEYNSKIISLESQLSETESKFISSSESSTERIQSLELELQSKSKNEKKLQDLEERLSVLENSSENSIQSLEMELKYLKSFLNETTSIIGLGAEALEQSLQELNRKYATIEEVQTQLSHLASRSSQTEVEIVQKLSSLSSSFIQLNSSHTEYRETLSKDLEAAQDNFKELLQSPFQLIEGLQLELGKESKELQSQVVTLSEELKDHKSTIMTLDEDLRTQLHIEKLRTRTTESQLSTIITDESSRAKSTEGKIKEALKSLENRVQESSSRFSTAESALLENINEELRRASTREEELLQEINNLRTHSSAQLHEKLLELQSSIQEEVHRAIKEEGKLREDLENFDTYFRTGLGNMEGALNSTNNSLLWLQGLQEGNYSFMGEKIETFGNTFSREMSRVEEFVADKLKLFDNHLLTLAGELDKKLESGNKALEKEMKKCCSNGNGGFWGGNWRNPRPTSPTSSTTAGGGSGGSGGVFNRVFSFLGGNANRRNSSSPNNSPRPKKEKQLKAPQDSRLRVDNVFDDEDQGEGDANGAKIIVQRSNSKVRNIYG